MDNKFVVPGSAKIGSIQQKLFVEAKLKLRGLLEEGRGFAIGLDIWTKQDMTASYLGVSAACYAKSAKCARHALLSLVNINHPHTAERIKQAMEQVLDEWKIPREKILLVITDNGSNMIAAFKDDW